MTAPAILTYGNPRRRIARVPLLFRARDCEDEDGIYALSYGKRVGLVHTRSGATGLATATDETGRLFRVPSDRPRVAWVMTSAGVRVRTLLLEAPATNLCLQPENFGSAPWVTAGTVSRVAAAHMASGVTLDLLGDTDAAFNSNFTQTITLPNGTACYSVDVKAGSATVTVVKLRSTGVADRGRLVLTWNAGVPSPVASGGTYLWMEARADGVYRVHATAPGVVGAETNALQFLPAGDSNAAATGTVYAGAVQVVASADPSSYIPTVAAPVTRAADSAYFPFLLTPRAMTAYVRQVNIGNFTAGPIKRFLHIGTSNSSLDPRILSYGSAAGLVGVQYDDGATFIIAEINPSAVRGDTIESRAVLSATWTVRSHVAKNGAAELSSNETGASGPATAWAGAPATKVFLAGLSSDNGQSALRDIIIGEDDLAMDQCRELAEVT